MTFVTWVLDDFTLATTGATGLLHREETLLHTYLTGTMTGFTGFDIIRILRAFTITGITRCRCGKADVFFHPFNRFFQGQFHHIAQVRTTARTLLTATAPKGTPKNIAELAKDIFSTKAAAEATTAHATFKGLMAHTVVHAAFFAVRQHFIGF